MINIENDGKKVYIFDRDENDNPTVEIKNKTPYFYVEDENGEYTTIFGRKVRKIETFTPHEIPRVREKYKTHYEADVVFTNRYLIDEYDEIPKRNIRKNYIDLEMEIVGDFPDVIEAPNALTSIGCFDDYLDRYVIFAVSKNGTEDVKRKGNTSVYLFGTEVKMLEKFVSFINDTNPDMFIAWNGNGYDFPYLIQRMNKVGVDPNKISRLGKSFAFRDKFGKVKSGIKGRVLLDLMEVYKYISYGNRESYSLGYISNYELGTGKVDYEGDLNQLREEDFWKFIEYNRMDVELMVELDSKLRLVDAIDAIRRTSRCNWCDCMTNSRIIDNNFLCQSKDLNIVLPSKKYIKEMAFKGAYVWQAEEGMYYDVAVFDWKSLYPNIIRTFDMSPEMIVDSPEEAKIIVKNEFIEPLYLKGDGGFVSGTVSKLLDARGHYKGMMKKAKEDNEYHAFDILQYSAKQRVNSLFGVLKEHSRLANRRIAEAITTMGQVLTKKLAEFAEEMGYKVIYGDTDSLFLVLGKLSYGKMYELAKELTRKINEWVRTEFGVEESTLELEFEKVYRTIIFLQKRGSDVAAKKRYAGHIIYKDGKEKDKIEIKGFENVRSDCPQMVRDFQEELFTKVLKMEDKEKIKEFIKEFDKKFEGAREDIGIPVTVTKPIEEYTKNLPIHIRAAKVAMERHGMQINAGDKIKYVYVKKQPKQFSKFENVVAFKDKIPEGYEIDYEKMYDRLATGTIRRLFHCLGWGEYTRQEKNQCSLDSF